MDFKEWWKEESLNTFDYPSEAAEAGFEAGQQSKQAEIDALQKRIDEALNVFKSDLSEIGKFDTIHKILKGEKK